MKFRYTILISGTNGAVQKDIEADNISKATITAKARVKEIWGLTAKLKQKIISREKDFYKDEYYSQNKETGRYKKEFTLMVKALNKTQDSGSRVFDRLFKVLDNAKQYKIIGDEIKRFFVPKVKINTLSYLLMEFLDSNKKSETQKIDRGFPYTLTFQRLSKDNMRVIYAANKQSFSMVLKGINITNKVSFAEKIAQKINAINSLKGV